MNIRTRLSSALLWLGLLGAIACFPACSGSDFTAPGGGGKKDGGAATGGAGGTGASGGTSGTGASGGTSGTGATGGTITGGTGGTTPDGGTGGSSLKANGTVCGTEGECQSGHCVDGVCCDSDCTGLCEACNASGSKGTCAPSTAGTDPDGDCQQANPSAASCEQVCDGQGACVSCGLFKCGTSSCLTSCTGDTDCKDGAWCNSGSCSAKQANGANCGAANQCTSGNCEGGYCCQTACGSPSACDTGQCLCGGAVCATGVNCQVWYLDQDGDGYPASSSYDKASCTQPADVNGKHYMVGPPTDCYDQNAQAHPGQTQFSTGDRGDGSFDFDCDGQETPEYTNVGSTGVCQACGQGDASNCVKCTVGPTPLPIDPGYLCSPSCGGGYKSAFKAAVSCGAKATLFTCEPVVNCGLNETYQFNVAQPCR